MAPTERAVLLAVGIALFSLSIRNLNAQEVVIPLVHEFSKAQAAQITPDGKMLMFHDWGHKKKETYKVVEIETGTILFTESYKTLRGIGFAGSNHILVKQDIYKNKGESAGIKFTAINLHSKVKTEQILLKENSLFNALITAVNEKRLLAIHLDPSAHNRRSFLSLVEFPGFQEIVKEPYANHPRESMSKIGGMGLSNDFDLMISAKRDKIVYSYDYMLMCRSTEDLRILWTQRMDPPLKAHRVAISADGAHVAAFATKSQWIPDQSDSTVFVYSGKTGELESRIPIKGPDGSAISPSGNGFSMSPDGKRFAVVDIRGEDNRWVVRIHIYDTQTGMKVTSILHDSVKSENGSKLPAYTNVHFTSDSQYLITSGINTKIWSLKKN